MQFEPHLGRTLGGGGPDFGVLKVESPFLRREERLALVSPLEFPNQVRQPSVMMETSPRFWGFDLLFFSAA